MTTAVTADQCYVNKVYKTAIVIFKNLLNHTKSRKNMKYNVPVM